MSETDFGQKSLYVVKFRKILSGKYGKSIQKQLKNR